jgi:hypothetical protein
MGNDAGEAFGPIVERNELFAGLVVDDERLIFHFEGLFTGPARSDTPRPRELEPLTAIDAVEIMRWPATAITAPGAGRWCGFENLGEERAARLS